MLHGILTGQVNKEGKIIADADEYLKEGAYRLYVCDQNFDNKEILKDSIEIFSKICLSNDRQGYNSPLTTDGIPGELSYAIQYMIQSLVYIKNCSSFHHPNEEGSREYDKDKIINYLQNSINCLKRWK